MMNITISRESANQLAIISETLKKESREDLQKMGIDIDRMFQTTLSDQHTIISETITTQPSTSLAVTQGSSELPMVKEGTVLLTDMIAIMDEFILAKCVFHPKFSTITSDLRDAYNKYYNETISLISFSKNFKEASKKYQIERVQRKFGTRSGVWYNGIGLKQ